jgi:Peptidase family M1 domain
MADGHWCKEVKMIKNKRWFSIRLGLLMAILFSGLRMPHRTHAAEPPPLPDPALLVDPIFARPGYGGVALSFTNRTRYLLAISIDSYQGILDGRAQVLFVNNTGVSLDRVVFRLFPNHPVHGARRMTIESLSVNGTPAAGTLDQSETVYSVPLASPLAPGGQLTFDFIYRIVTPATSFFYVSEAFPFVAVYDQSGWRVDVESKGLDYAYTESSLFAVNLRAATNVGTWFVGSIKNSQDNGDGTTTYTIVTGPVRNFLIIQVRGWSSFKVPDRDGKVPINILYSGSQQVAQEISQIAAEAFDWMDVNFAPYPYAGFDIIVMRFPSGGEEYPGMILVNNERDSSYRRFITVHEVGHQWFYGIAGNDVLRHAWLDESATQVAGYLYWATRDANLAEDYWQYIMRWYNRIVTPRPINTPMDQYTDFADYMSTTYGGGAVFLREIANTMGSQEMIRGLGVYVQSVNLGVGTPCQFFNALQSQTAQDLRTPFQQRAGVTC